jgi:hypothetical protein
MRQLILWALVLGLAASASALTPSTNNVFQPVQKPWNEISRQDGVRVQGDTVGDPFIVDALPFTATGNTCSFINDYDYACPYSGSTSADVVYKWIATAGGTGTITVDLCASIYDTKVYIYDSSMAVIACNDDYCSFQSRVANVPVTVGGTYYTVAATPPRSRCSSSSSRRAPTSRSAAQRAFLRWTRQPIATPIGSSWTSRSPRTSA